MSGKYGHLDRDTLIRLLERRDSERQLGLVWERDEEKIEQDRALNSDYVALDLDPSLSHGAGPWSNLIIEGDNYDALRALRASLKGKVRCIYIDPPYNTGNRDFVYNDRFIEKTHSFRHSLWLEFMHKRLRLAKELLADDGVIFVSIDDNEAFRLGMLLDAIFGEANFIGCFIWRKVDSPNDNKVAITPDHEFLLCYAARKDLTTLLPMHAPGIRDAYGKVDESGRAYRDRLLKKNGKNSLRKDRPTMFFPIPGPDGKDVLPIHDNGEEARWSMGREGIARHIEEGTLIWQEREKLGKKVWEPYTREFAPDEPTRPHPTIWSDLPTMRQAKAMLRDIFSTADLFSTPKPIELIARVLSIVGDKSAIVLDFFAGSGTTAHAVAKLNTEDGGNRKFILVSNTEATVDEPEKNLCRDICAERVRRVMVGYRTPKGERIEGLDGSFAYLRTRRVPQHRLNQKLAHTEIWNALELAHGLGVSVWNGKGHAIRHEETQTVAYLADFLPASVDALIADLGATSVTAVTLYSWSPERARELLPEANHQPIPQFLRDRFGNEARP